MADPNDDLFSDLEPVATPVPSRTSVPSLAEGLRDLGLLVDHPSLVPATVETAGPIDDAEVQVEASSDPETEEQDLQEHDQPIAVEVEPVLDPSEEELASIEPEQAPEPAPHPAPEAVSAPMQIESVVELAMQPQPVVAQDSGPRRRWSWVAGAALVAVAIGGLVLSTTNKGSTTPVTPQAPAVAKQDPEHVVEPVAVETVAAAPAPSPAPEPAVVAVDPQPEPEAKPVAASPPAPASAAKPTPVAKPKREKPKSNPKPTPAEPEPERQWQDDAMDALDDFEKRL